MIFDWKKAIHYPPELPVSAAVEQIIAALSAHQVLILQSETGSGKSTQIPKMVVEFLGKEHPLIAMTQPRRLATKLLAQRLNHELSGGTANFVGWQVRFEKQLHSNQLIKVMTEGVLWQEMLHRPLLPQYDALILDEIHERSTTLDLLLGGLIKTLKKRPDFKLILLSATLSAPTFQQFFKSCGFISLEGRSYPIEDFYCPSALQEPLEKILWAIDEAETLSGDILLFCATEAEILFYYKKLQQQRPNWQYSCLYARMLHQQQKNLFQRSAKRRIILATNIAETSVTLPGIRIVIDLGTQKILQFHPQYRVSSYPIVPISQQSITQRRGRAGRQEPGWCFHLYSLEDSLSRPNSLPPEIQRSSLSQVILQVLSLKQGSVESFPFISPPSSAQLREAVKTLKMLGMIDESGRISALGKKVARYPVEPRFCVILFEALKTHCAYLAAIIVAFLSGDDPRLRPLDHADKADKAHLKYLDVRSDFISILSLWVHIQEMSEQHSKKAFQQYCAQHFLNPLALRSWELQIKQLCELFMIKPREITLQSIEQDVVLVHRALLSGFFDRIYHKSAKKGGKNTLYHGPHQSTAVIHPSSMLKNTTSDWIFSIAQQQDKNGQTLLRWVGPVELSVAQKYLEKQVIYQYSAPFYAPEIGEVMVHQSGQVWGLPLLPAKALVYRLIDLDSARYVLCQHFIKEWLENNFEQITSWHQPWMEALELARRSRRAALLLDSSELASKIWEQKYWPELMISGSTVTRYCHTLPAVSASFFLKEAVELSIDRFPCELIIDNHLITIEYDDSQGAEGFLHYSIPLACWASQQPSSWLIRHPYFGIELLLCLLQQLPKKERQKIDNLDECALFFKQEYCHNQRLLEALTIFLYEYYDISCSVQNFKIYQIPSYLIPHFWIEKQGSIDYLGGYDFDEKKFFLQNHTLKNATTVSIWADIILSAQRGIYRLYLQQSQEWTVFSGEEYWTWRALLMQQYALKISWNQVKSSLSVSKILISEKLLVYRGIYVGQYCKKNHVTITQEADFIALSKSAFSKDYPSFLQLMADTFEYELSQLSSSLWPPVWQPLKRALETPLWLSHINPEILERCHIWMGALRRALDKAPRKPHLVQQWSDLWDKLRSHQKISTLREAHPFWLIAIEGLVALFDETQTPFFPWSEKKIISALEKKELW